MKVYIVESDGDRRIEAVASSFRVASEISTAVKGVVSEWDVLNEPGVTFRVRVVLSLLSDLYTAEHLAVPTTQDCQPDGRIFAKRGAEPAVVAVGFTVDEAMKKAKQLKVEKLNKLAGHGLKPA